MEGGGKEQRTLVSDQKGGKEVKCAVHEGRKKKPFFFIGFGKEERKPYRHKEDWRKEGEGGEFAVREKGATSSENFDVGPTWTSCSGI